MTTADLSPEALARLEAKLVADLEMVRRVRALLEEHSGVLGRSPSLATSLVPGQAETPVVRVPPRPLEEVLMECLVTMPRTPFSPEDFKRTLAKEFKSHPEGKSVKAFLSRMIRLGKVEVHEFRKGRFGCLYRCLLPPPASPEYPTEAAGSSPDAPN